MSYKIEMRILELAMRQAVDSAVHNAVDRFSDRLGDNVGLTHKIARAAAETAIEQFASYCNAELRLIEIDYERRADEMMMRHPRLVIDPTGAAFKP